MLNAPADWAIFALIALLIYGFGELIEICQRINRQLRRLIPKNTAEKGSLALLNKLRADFEKEDISSAKREKLCELLTDIQDELSKET